MTLIISDTSPIRALHHLSLLHLLEVLFDKVIVPPAVVNELNNPRGRFMPLDIERVLSVAVRSPADHVIRNSLTARLQAGESEAIALALEMNAELLIDERAGRKEATRRGIRIVGVLGVLLRAKQRGLVPAVVPLAQKLRDEIGFFLSPALMDELRLLAREP